MIRLGLNDVDAAFAYSASTASYVDETTDINDAGVGDVAVFSSTCINGNDALYIGHQWSRFGRISACISTPAAASPTVTWEYFNSSGSAWTTVPEIDSNPDFTVAGSTDLIMSSSVYDLFRESWGRTAVNGSTMYWLRARVTSVAGGGSGATLTSGSVDITMPNGMVQDNQSLLGREHQSLSGIITQDINNANKRSWQITFAAADIHDAHSLRERAAFTKSASLNFGAEWDMDVNAIECVIDMQSPFVADPIPPDMWNLTAVLKKVN